MGMWGIILLVVCVMYATMIGFGLFFYLAGPKKINFVFGYRSPMSMKNLNTWKFGNIYAGRCMWSTGAVLLVGSLVTLFVVMNSSETVIRNAGIVIIIAHAVMIFGSVISTEIALRKRFDHHGNPKA